MEHLVTAAIVAPFVITMVGFAVAIAFAPAVPNRAAGGRRGLRRFSVAEGKGEGLRKEIANG
jgi:hypothetical protein